MYETRQLTVVFADDQLQAQVEHLAHREVPQGMRAVFQETHRQHQGYVDQAKQQADQTDVCAKTVVDATETNLEADDQESRLALKLTPINKTNEETECDIRYPRQQQVNLDS